MAQTGQIIDLKNRPGKIHDGARSEASVRGLIRDLRRLRGSGMKLEFRCDGAFFHRPLLQRYGCEYAIKVPMWRWPPFMERASPSLT